MFAFVCVRCKRARVGLSATMLRATRRGARVKLGLVNTLESGVITLTRRVVAEGLCGHNYCEQRGARIALRSRSCANGAEVGRVNRVATATADSAHRV